MHTSISDLSNFYSSPLGSRTFELLQRKLTGLWSDFSEETLLGIGFPFPFMEAFTPFFRRSFVFTLEKQGATYWPYSGPNATALVDPESLPLPDCSVNRILVAHAMEIVEDPAEFLSELWRILDPGGRIIIITPNRRGLWARLDTTPFGSGQPFSHKQLKDLLNTVNFSVEKWIDALYMPPLENKYLLRSAPVWEKIGGGFLIPFAGLHIVEASKQLYRPVLVNQPVKNRRTIFLPSIRPVTRVKPE